MSVNYTPPPLPAPTPYVAPPMQDRADADSADASDSSSPSEKFMDIVFKKLNADAKAQAGTTAATAQKADLNSTIAGQDAAGLATSDTTLDPGAAKKLAGLLNHLLSGLPADQKNAAIAALQSGGSAQEVTSALIAAGLSPEQLAKLIDELKKKQSEMGDILAGTVQVVPPPVQREPIFAPGSAPTAKAAPVAKTETPDIASQVNPLTLDNSGNASAEAASHGPTFDNVLKVFENAQQFKGISTGKAPQIGSASPAAAGTPGAAPSPGLSTVPGAAGANGDIDFSAAMTGQVYPDGLGWSQKNSASAAGQVAGLTVTGNAVMTSIATSAAQAVTPHPATQIVATAITKGAADGQSKDIVVKLDPPELGKVEVRMTIDKEHTVRAHIMVEKPETYNMLQRDSHVLQRALTDAGLDVGGNSLSFEMAQDNSSFGNDFGNGRGHNGGGALAGDTGADSVIETTMDWRFDEASGHYNIWA